MKKNKSISLCLLCCYVAYLPFSLAQVSNTEFRLNISHQARSLQPGEVVLAMVQSSKPLKRLQGNTFDKTFLFYPLDGSETWLGLIGIDLETTPGRYRLKVQAVALTGEESKSSYTFLVTGKKFPIRRLKVDEKYVNPPTQILKRIGRESNKIKAIFSKISGVKMWNGHFLLPVSGTTTSGFGRRSVLNGQPRSPHSGTDFRANEGTPVLAPNSGMVVLAEDLYYSGKTVIIDHGQGLYSYFGHLSHFLTQKGEMISSADLVGYVGSTGRVTGPHLHWSIRLNGSRVDPLSLVTVLSKDRLE